MEWYSQKKRAIHKRQSFLLDICEAFPEEEKAKLGLIAPLLELEGLELESWGCKILQDRIFVEEGDPYTLYQIYT